MRDRSAQISIDYKKARFVRIELDGYNALSLAEVQFFRAENIAWKKQARQSSNVIKLRNSNTILYLGFFFM